jgi:uncharacterized membrane protein
MMLRVAFVGFLLLYPLLVYFGLRVLPPSFFGLLLAVLILPRLFALKAGERMLMLPLMLLLFLYAIGATIYGRAQALFYYPVLVNLLMCVTFAASALGDEPLLLRLVRSRGAKLSEHAPRYLKGLTCIWAGFFAVNALIALWTTTASLEVWTLYNGLIAYVLVALLISAEWLYRGHYKKMHGVSNH